MTLLEAVDKTLKGNAHLCDGDNCTLKDLRDTYHEVRHLMDVAAMEEADGNHDEAFEYHKTIFKAVTGLMY